MPLSIYAGDIALNALYGAVAWPGGVPATLYVALMSVAPTASGGGTEASGGTYARAAVANNLTNFPAASGGLKTNASSYGFGTPTSGNFVAIAFYDASSAGNLLHWELFPSPINSGGGAVTIGIGIVTFQVIPPSTFATNSGSGSFMYQDNKFLDFILGGQSIGAPSTWYFAMITSTPLPTDTTVNNEVSGGSYARASIVNNTTNFPGAASLSTALAVALTWPTPTANWGSITGITITDASSSGNPWMYLLVNNGNPVSILNGQAAPSAGANQTTIQVA